MVLKDLRWNTHVNHKSYNFLDCDCFKKVLFSTYCPAKLLSDSLLLDSSLSDSLITNHIQCSSLNQPITFKVVITCCVRLLSFVLLLVAFECLRFLLSVL